MPEPFRLFAPPPLKTEKVVLTHSGDLFLALPANIVREVLLNVSVQYFGNHATTLYQEQAIPVILGQKVCPPQDNVPIVILKTNLLKTGLLGMACSSVPKLAAISDPEWVTTRTLPPPWLSDGKGYRKGQILFTRSVGIVLSEI